MNLRCLGNTQLLASEIALGTVELGLDYGIPTDGAHLRPSEDQAVQVLNTALDLGINFVSSSERRSSVGATIMCWRRSFAL